MGNQRRNPVAGYNMPSTALPYQRAYTPYLILAAICSGIFIAGLDMTVVVTALPEIILDMRLVFPTEIDQASWIITGYLLGFTVAMPLMGRISDVYGRRRIYILAILIFMGGSALVALANNIHWLVGARVLQAVGGGAILPVAKAIVGDTFPEMRRAVALGIIGASAEAGGVLGPLWGGIITNYVSWRWIFWINLPIGFVIILLVMLLLARGRPLKIPIDYVGGFLIGGSLAGITVGLSFAPNSPIPLSFAILALVGAVVLFVLFLIRESKVSHPLIPLAMFRNGAFSGASATYLLVGGALIMAMVNVPLMTDTILGFADRPLEGGLRLMRLTAAIPAGAIIGGFLTQRWGYRIPTVLGLLLTAAGFYLMSTWDLSIGDPGMTIHLVLAGLGFGLVIAPVTTAVINSSKPEDRGIAAALITVMRMVGMVIGLSVITSWGLSRFDTLAQNLPSLTSGTYQQELNEAGLTVFTEIFLIALGISLAALVPAILLKGRTKHPKAVSTASPGRV